MSLTAAVAKEIGIPTTNLPTSKPRGINVFRPEHYNTTTKTEKMRLIHDSVHIFCHTSIPRINIAHPFFPWHQGLKIHIQETSVSQHGKVWSDLLSGRAESMVDYSLCPKVEEPDLAYGVGETKKFPKLVKWSCVNEQCGQCGISKKLKTEPCPLFSINTATIK